MKTLFEETRPLRIGPAEWSFHLALVEDAQGFLLRGTVTPAAAAVTLAVDGFVAALYAYPTEAQMGYSFDRDAAKAALVYSFRRDAGPVFGPAVLTTTLLPVTGGAMTHTLPGARQARALLPLLRNGVPDGHYRWYAWPRADFENHWQQLGLKAPPGWPHARTGLYRLPRCLLPGAAARRELEEIARQLETGVTA